MSFASRFGAAFRVSLASSIAYATVGTLLVSMLAIPLLEILFSVLLAKDVGSMDVLRTAYASTLVGIGLGVCSGVVSKTATDRNLGVFQVVHEYRRVDLAYWLASLVMPVLLALPAGVASLAVITVMSGHASFAVVARLALLVVCAVLVGGLLGISMSGVGLALSDPVSGCRVRGRCCPGFGGCDCAGRVVPAMAGPVECGDPADWCGRCCRQLELECGVVCACVRCGSRLGVGRFRFADGANRSFAVACRP